jgi:hypothetical protein
LDFGLRIADCGLRIAKLVTVSKAPMQNATAEAPRRMRQAPRNAKGGFLGLRLGVSAVAFERPF